MRSPFGPRAGLGWIEKGGTLEKRAGPRTKGGPKETNPWVELPTPVYTYISWPLLCRGAEDGLPSNREHLRVFYFIFSPLSFIPRSKTIRFGKRSSCKKSVIGYVHDWIRWRIEAVTELVRNDESSVVSGSFSVRISKDLVRSRNSKFRDFHAWIGRINW